MKSIHWRPIENHMSPKANATVDRHYWYTNPSFASGGSLTDFRGNDEDADAFIGLARLKPPTLNRLTTSYCGSWKSWLY